MRAFVGLHVYVCVCICVCVGMGVGVSVCVHYSSYNDYISYLT